MRARRLIWPEQSVAPGFPLICEGWVAATATLQNGRRQIVSFLLPGDVVSTKLLFHPHIDFRMEAITDVTCRIFDRAELRALLFAQPGLFDTFASAWTEEKSQAEQLAVDLGRRGAEERVARLILNLMRRLEKRGLVGRSPIRFDFPLRQYHIADATGLTTVYVNGILTAFRDAGLIELSERSLVVKDLGGLKRAASD